MLPPGFLGTRADILMDLVVCSLAIILPLLGLSWSWARAQSYSRHRNLMVGLGSTLGFVVLLFEIDMRLAGGIFELTKDSSYAGTLLMNVSIYGHTLLSISTSIIWVWLLIKSWRAFPRPPEPGAFSEQHKRWGRIGMWAMALTGITGIELYVLGFML